MRDNLIARPLHAIVRFARYHSTDLIAAFLFHKQQFGRGSEL